MFGNGSSRRPGSMSGGGEGNNGGGGQRRFGNNGGGGQGEGGGQRGGGDRPRSVWAKAETLYSDFSCIELNTVAEWFRSAAAIKLAPAIAATSEGENRRYNHEDGLFISFSLRELVALTHQLRAFIDNRVDTVTVLRNQGNAPHKVLSFYNASELDGFGDTDLAVELSEYAEGFVEGAEPSKTMIFVAKPELIQLSREGEGVAYYGDLEAMLAFFQSFVANVARVDFASVRLIDSGEKQQRGPTPQSAAMPTRRAGPGASMQRQAAPAGDGGAAPSSEVDEAFDDADVRGM